MSLIDIEKYWQIPQEEITEEDKENVFLDLCTLQIPPNVEVQNLIKLFLLAQDILRFKGDQVESVVTELDNLAIRLGEEEAKHSQSYLKIDDLHSTSTRTDKDGTSADTDDYHRQLVKMEIQNDRILSELQEKEQELINEKKEIEKLLGKLSSLEDENRALKSELQSTQQELASNASLKLITEEQDYPTTEKYQELMDLLRQKNKHITQLLSDIEDMEKENNHLKDKLSIVRDELVEGAEQMSKLSMERINLSTNVDELKTKVSTLEQENIALRSQISELVNEKENRDKQLENINISYENKLQQLKEILQKKDTELSTLKIQMSINNSSKKMDDSSHLTHLKNLSQNLAEREKQIIELQQQLKQATIDLNESTQLLEEQKKMFQLKFDQNFELNIIKQLEKKLEQAESRVAVLEAKAKHAEEDSLKKAEEVTELIIQLREYESGTYGLEDAMLRIKDLQKQKQVRDNQIEQLVQNLNQLQDEANLLDQENQILRDRLEIPPGEQIVVENFSRKNREKQNELLKLNEQLERNNDELLSLKLENRSLKKEIMSLHTELNSYRIKEPPPVQEESADSSMTKEKELEAVQSFVTNDLKDSIDDIKFQEVIDENESLRKGMHEILESIRDHDGSSAVQIESETLEKLLEALDSRHVNGWYQPGMRLQAHIHHLNGVNKTLREELHMSRSKEEEYCLKLHEVNQKLKQLEELTEQKLPQSLFESKISSPKLTKSVSCAESPLKSNRELETELSQEKDKCQRLESELEKLRDTFIAIEEQMDKINDKFNIDKESWYNVKSAMQKEIDDLKNNEVILQMKVNEYEKSLEIIKEDPEEIKKAFAENTFSISSLKVDLQQMTRKCQVLLELENQIRQERNKLTDDIHTISQTKDHEILQLKTENDSISYELKKHFQQLDQFVSQTEHQKVIKELNQLTVKHREVLHKQIITNSDRDKLLSKIQQEISMLLSEKIELEITLKQVFEENRHLKCSTANTKVPEQLVTLTKQLATAELDIINKRQHSDHINRMFELTKEQLIETENRCTFLEEQLLKATEINSELQLNEANLKEKILKYPSESEFEELMSKLQQSENTINVLSTQKRELEEVANIAQDQIKALERYNRYQDFEHDSLQRRILELQSLSDEKMIIDRLSKELLLVQENDITTNDQIEAYKNKMVKLETEMLQTKMKLTESENEYHRLKKDSNNKIRSMFSIIYELQKRYLSSFPLIKEELCFESLLRNKEEHYALTTLILDQKLPSISEIDENNPDQNEITRSKFSKESNSKFKMQDFNMRLINEGLQNKIQIYAERLDRQDKLISRLEQEIIHADEQCEEFLLYWSPHSNLKLSTESDGSLSNKSTQTQEIKEEKYETISYDYNDNLKQANATINELQSKLKTLDDDLQKTKDQLAHVMMEVKEKEITISVKEKEILNLQKLIYERGNRTEQPEDNQNDENSIKKLALKVTVDSLQNIINQKEETIKRLQNLLKKNREEHYQSTLELQRELKSLQESVDSKEHSYNKLKTKLDAIEKVPPTKTSFIDSYLTKIHKLEDELNEANEKFEQLSLQLVTTNQQAEHWSHTAEERLKILQNMKHELDAKHNVNTPMASEPGKLSYTSLLQMVKEKSEEIDRLNQNIEEFKQRLGSGEKLLGYRDRLKNELDRYKRKVELLEQKEKEDKAEIQRLKNQIITRPQSARKKDSLISPKEEQLIKKVKVLEEQLEEFVAKEKKWKEMRRTKCDEEVEKWQNRKKYQQNYEKLRQQLKDQTVHLESVKATNERLKETIIRLEKERFTLESKLKIIKSQNSNIPLIEELQKSNNKLEEEIRILRKTCEMTGSSSLTDVIEAQDRKITALELAQKGDCALAEEVERLNERKSQLQKYNVHLEKENMRLKLEIDDLRTRLRIPTEPSEGSSRGSSRNEIRSSEEVDGQLKGNRRKNGDLEKAVLVLRRVVEKLQAENKRLHNSKINQLQDKNYVEKLQAELQNLQENYLDAIEKVSILDKELQIAHEKIESLQKLIHRLQSGEEISSMKAQLVQKNQLLTKVKVLLEKTALRERELIDKVNDLERINPSSC